MSSLTGYENLWIKPRPPVIMGNVALVVVLNAHNCGLPTLMFIVYEEVNT